MGQKRYLFAFLSLAMIMARTEALTGAPTRSTLSSSMEINPGDMHNGKSEWDCMRRLSRRGIIQQSFKSAMIGTVSTFALVGTPRSSLAGASASQKSEEGLMSASALANLIHPVPTFTIVDENGVPFTVVGEDAKVTGYFFTTYGEAARILQLAKKSADKAISKAKAEKEKDIGVNPWTKARVSSVPLDYAVTVVSKSMRMTGGGVYFKIAPAEDDIDDALRVTGDEDLAEGKVPLFYYEDFTIDDDGTQKTPLYFRKDELEKEWRRSNKTKEPPKISVTELFSLLTTLVRPGETQDDLRNLVFVPPKESKSKSQDCIRKGGDQPAFVVGKRIIVL